LPLLHGMRRRVDEAEDKLQIQQEIKRRSWRNMSKLQTATIRNDS